MSHARKNIMLGTAGHVDHGKTALVKLLTGCETDTLAAEKERGLTIDLGFARCRLADERVVGVVDVPGHVDFIRNMVAGAHGVDVVIFVVAADDGIMPQTVEHLRILSLMGLRHGVVALTKVDLVDAARREAVHEDLRRLLAGTFLARARVCPMSNPTGEGFEAFFDALNEAATACEARPCAGIFRMWIEDVFTLKGTGTVITGIPSSGAVRAGESLTLLPSGLAGRVRRVQVYGEDAGEARAGECVALNIPEIEHAAARRGMTLGEPGAPDPCAMAEGELLVLDSIKGQVEDMLEAHVHVGTASAVARLAMLEKPAMTAGERQMVQLRFAAPLPLVPGERFVVRANLPGQTQGGLVTIGGGRIAAVTNVRLRRNKQWTLDMLRARQAALDDPLAWCETVLGEAGRPLTLEEVRAKCLLRHDEVVSLIERLEAASRIVRLPGGGLAHARLVGDVARKMRSVLEAFHAAHPQRAGLSREELFAPAAAAPEICESAARSLVASGELQWAGAVYARPGWSPRLPDEEQQASEAVGTAFLKAGWVGPAVAELAQALKQPAQRVEKSIRLLAERGVLVRLEGNMFVHRDAVEEAKRIALKLLKAKRSFSTMEFRDALAVSRKYAVPLLDYLDKTRFTVRTGHDRTAGAEAKKMSGSIE